MQLGFSTGHGTFKSLCFRVDGLLVAIYISRFSTKECVTFVHIDTLIHHINSNIRIHCQSVSFVDAYRLFLKKNKKNQSSFASLFVLYWYWYYINFHPILPLAYFYRKIVCSAFSCSCSNPPPVPVHFDKWDFSSFWQPTFHTYITWFFIWYPTS